MNASEALIVSLATGGMVAVPRSLNSISTYVLLEQEAWFEKEAAFLLRWLKPGMTALDIGASIGFYSVLMARLVGPQGRVYAYEPASEPRAFLERNRSLNDATNVEILTAALSDTARSGNLTFGISSELNALGSGVGEPVNVTTLDLEQERLKWRAPDFVKLDVEGEEQRVVEGGRVFFERNSPLVMFETKIDTEFNSGVQRCLAEKGYGLYRQVGGDAILLPTQVDERLDDFELNAFAAKEDRAGQLESEGFLVRAVPRWSPREEDRQLALHETRVLPCARPFGPSLLGPVNEAYLNALAGYSVWRSPAVPAPQRCAALAFALTTLRELCEHSPTVERLSSLVRMASDWGARKESLQFARRIAAIVQQGPIELKEPFWPASPAYDAAEPGGPPELLLFGASSTHLERASHYSSFYTGGTATVSFLAGLPGAPTEMERRRLLSLALAGHRPRVPPSLRTKRADHLNAELWASGAVPGTVV